MNPVLVEVWRGTAIESEHAGALAVLDADGAVLATLGDIDRPVFPRSAVKALQAMPLVESDAAERLQLSDDELAVACASHNGEPEHVRTVAGMLAKVDVDADVLECGTHWPYLDTAVRAMAARGESPSALNNNCSGKHAGFVCLACALMGWNDGGLNLRQYASGYVKPDHPVMLEVMDALQSSTGFDLAHAPRGTDGCSIPTYAIPLRHLAHAFAKFGAGVGLREGQCRAAKRLRQAVANSPFMVGGTGRFDTLVMQRLGERVFCKVGAEGMYCAALPERGLGVAIKISDGNNARAAEVVMAAAIEALLSLDDDDMTFMHRYSDASLRNWNGIEVGALRATVGLREALRRA
ncbi:MAG TPA: asparaginase [Albitalea sp.]